MGHQFNNYFIPPLLTSYLLIILLIFIIFKSSRSIVNVSFCLIVLSAAVWLFSYAQAYQISESEHSLFWFRIGYVGVNFIAITMVHFTIEFLKKCKLRKFVFWAYFYGLVCSFMMLKTNYIINGTYKYFWGYYPRAGKFHFIFLGVFVTLIGLCLLLLILAFLKEERFSIRQRQINYILLSIFVFDFASVDFIPNYGIGLYPFGYLPTTLLVFIISYAIFKYQILDIKIAITRVGIFAIVYSLVLGIPYGLIIWQKNWLILIGGENWFWIPMVVVTILATVGPSVYLFMQKQAEDRLLKEQRRYQATLRQASAGMGKIKDLKKLLNMIVYVLTHAIQIEHALVYMYDGNQKSYTLKAAKRKSGNIEFISSIEEKSLLAQRLLDTKSLLILEEIKQKSQDYKDSELYQIAQVMQSMFGELIVPIFIDQNLTAVIVMGKKISGKVYAEDDLAVFSILANQTALAIENAKFYEDMKLTHQQLFQAEKMATIGTMADGLSHQINNRFHALGFIAGDALDTIRLSQNEIDPQKIKETFGELERAFTRVQENVVQGGEIVQGLLKYTRKGDVGLTAIDVDAVLNSAVEMTQFKIKTDQLKIIRDYDTNTIPKVKANFTQLQEVFFNLIDNGYDAMMQRKVEAKEPGYQPTLIVHVFKEDSYAHVIFEDNGMGVKDEDVRKLFTPFFTTKLSSKKGTGLGLYVIKKIVEDNHSGKVEMVSKYMQGTQMKLRLPIAIG